MLAIFKQPEWIPNWLWDEHRKIKTEAEIRQSSLQGEMAKFSRKFISDIDCCSVWRILDTLHDKLEPALKIQVNVLYQRLLTHAVLAFEGPRAEDLIPASERKRRGEKIAKLSQQLRKELKFFKGAPPVAILDRLGASLSSMNEAYQLYTETDLELLLARKKLALFKAANISRWIFFGAEKDSILIELEIGVDEWSRTRPVAYRPNEKSAARSFFIRQMTSFFVVCSNQPYRKAVASMTNCLFDGDVSALDVTKIAPIKRRPPPSNQKKSSSSSTAP